MPTSDRKPLDLKDIESTIADADRIAAEGKDRDGALTTLAKGMADGLRGLVDLVKGTRGKPHVEPDGDEGMGGAGGEPKPEDDKPSDDEKPTEGGEGGEDEDPDGDEPADGKPGYEDMRMGGKPGDEYVDATEYILALEKKVGEQGGEIKALRKAVAAGNKDVAEVKALLTGFVESYTATVAPLQKAVLGISESLLDLPAAVHNPGLDARRAAARHAVEAAAKKDETGIDVVKLAKGMKARLIDESQASYFKRHGKFDDDEKVNDELVQKIKAL